MRVFRQCNLTTLTIYYVADFICLWTLIPGSQVRSERFAHQWIVILLKPSRAAENCRD